MGFPVRFTVNHSINQTINCPDGASLSVPANTFSADQTLYISGPQPIPNQRGTTFAGYAYVLKNVSAAPQSPALAMTFYLPFLQPYETWGDHNSLWVMRSDDVSDTDPGCWLKTSARVDPATACMMGGTLAANATVWGAYAVGK